MNDKDLKRRLEDELESIAPKMSQRVANAPIGTSSEGGAKRARAPRRKVRFTVAVSAIAAVLVIAIVLAVVVPPLFETVPEQGEAGYLLMNINPDVEILFDEDGKVTSVKSGNADADVLLADESFRSSLVGESVDTAAAAVAERALEMGYIDGDATSPDAVGLTVVGGDGVAKIGAAVRAAFVDAGAACVVVAKTADRAWLADPSTDIEIPVAAGGVDEGSASWSTPTFQLYPAGDPRPADVNQHGIGDCCLCAALASMAYIYPDFIKQEVIKAKGNGVYDIAMYDPQGNPVTVSVTTSCLMNNGSIVAVSGKDNVATWATLLEKAVMKWNVIYQKSPSLGGIGTEIVPPLFTGNGGSIAYGAGQLNAQQLDEVVDIMLENGAIVVGGFTTGNITITPGPFYTVNGHAYTLMWSPDPDALFIMRNPWGSAAGSPDGKEDGAMDILDDGIIPPLIDLRIVEPGAAAPYMENPLLPYTPPQFSAGSFWLTPQLMKYYNL